MVTSSTPSVNKAIAQQAAKPVAISRPIVATPSKVTTLKATTPAPAAQKTISSNTGGWGAVANILNPFANDAINLNNPFTGKTIIKDVGAPVRGIVRAGEGALVIAGSIAASGAATLGAAAGGATATGRSLLAAPSWFLPAAAAGYLLGNKAQPQNLTQAQTPTQNTNTNTNTQQNTYTNLNQMDKSIRQQYTYNTIEGSPYANIGGSPTLSGGMQQNPNITPTQTAPTYINPSQSSGQSAEQSNGINANMLIIAAAAIFLLKK